MYGRLFYTGGAGMIYSLTIPGRPLPKGRPRFTRSGHAYTPKTTRLYEQKIRDICKEHFDEAITDPVSVRVRFCISGKKTIDIDNLQKSLFDGLQPDGLADDSQIYYISAERVQIADSKLQRTEVEIWVKEG
jgi:crossover junction endodeoxyribonuclease RusA